MLETFEVSKVLIIAPLRVARDTWPAEIEKWDHLQGLDISVIVGDTKTRIAALHHPAMIYVINRENIKWLVEYYEKNGMRWDFGMVVIDELSSFKNYQSQRFKFLRKVRPYVKRWVGLTGTPSSNGLMDLWAEIGILDGGERLGKFIGRYREAYFKASSMNPSTGVVFQYKPREGAEELIYQRISDITISMKALDYLHMPDCIPSRYEVEMNTQERELYDMLRKDLLIQQYKKICFQFAEAVIASEKSQNLGNANREHFIEQFIKKANELPEANRRLLDLLYETAWHTIYVFKYGTAPEKVPAPWYDRMGGVEK